MNRSNLEASLKRQPRSQPKHSAQRKYHSIGGVCTVATGKENVAAEQQANKMPVPAGANISRKLNYSPNPAPETTSLACGSRPKKYNADPACEQTRPKGLQEIDTFNQGDIPKRRNNTTNDTSGPKPFVRTRFSIYDESRNNKEDESTGKIIYFKSTAADKSSLKSTCLRENVKTNSIPIQNRENNAKLSVRRTSSAKVSPKDISLIPKPNVFKIKENHKWAPVTKKTHKAAYDVLSLELAYNLDYMCEYVRFQMEINERKVLSPSFLTKGVTADQRALVVKYLIKATTYYKYPSFILYQAVKIFDAYIDAVDVSLNELQVAALAALWIALKKDLVTDDIPEASTIIELAGTVFQGDKTPLIQCERKVLMSLNFEISFAEPFSMLALYTVMIEEVRELSSNQVQELYYCGSYLIDLSLLHDKMLSISAVHLAAISAEIALVLIMTSAENLSTPQWSHWRNRVFMANPIIEKYRLSDFQMNHIRNQLLQKVMLSKECKTDFFIVYKKYNTKRYGSVANFMITRISELFVQRIRDPNYSAQPILF